MVTATSLFSATNHATGASGVDVYDKVRQMLEKQNTVAPVINAALKTDHARLSALGQLQNALAAFQGQAGALAGKGVGLAANVADAAVLDAQTGAKAKAGTHEVQVQNLASAQTLSARAQANAKAPIGTGAASVLKIELGAAADGRFTPSGRASTSIVIDARNNTLDGIAAAVNATNIGVKAAVTQGKDGAILSLTGPTGEQGGMRVGLTGDAALAGLLRYDPAGGQSMTAAGAARDARFTIDGEARTASSNTIADAVPGVTLTLKAAGGTRVTVAGDGAQVAANVKGFVDGYNALVARLADLREGELKSGGTAREVARNLDATVRGFAGARADGGAGLNAIGVTVRGDGTLALDEARLKAADPAAVARLMTDGGQGLADRMAELAGGLTGKSGAIAAELGRVNRDIAALDKKKAGVEQTMAVRANALVKLYTQQTSNPASGIVDGIPTATQGVGTLFNMMG